MNEIIIEDKKYVSSKQAAQISGYAKDYIGQLCREGRIPARLIGRSWYVLESALKDHRFGGEDQKRPEVASAKKDQIPSMDTTWEKPSYKPEEPAYFPFINKLAAKPTAPPKAVTAEEGEQAISMMHEAWKNWFSSENKEEVANLSEIQPEEAVEESEEVHIPIREVEQISASAVEELEPLPREVRFEEAVEEEAEEPRERIARPASGLTRGLQVVFLAIALVAVAVSALGSGYLEGIATSNQVAAAISGINIVSK